MLYLLWQDPSPLRASKCVNKLCARKGQQYLDQETRLCAQTDFVPLCREVVEFQSSTHRGEFQKSFASLSSEWEKSGQLPSYWDTFNVFLNLSNIRGFEDGSSKIQLQYFHERFEKNQCTYVCIFVVVDFFHNLLTHIWGADSTFCRTEWTGRIALTVKNWQRYSVLFVWRSRSSNEFCPVYGPRGPHGQPLFERETVWENCDRYFSEITTARTLIAVNKFHFSSITRYRDSNSLNGYSYCESNLFNCRQLEP